jgi:predicted transcriptional regulator
MGKMSSDPLVSTEAEIEVDQDTAAAIERGIRAADNDELVTPNEARERLLTQWNGKSSSQNRR